MGCYDEISFRCPNCGGIVIEQSKAGDCDMSIYSLNEAPSEIIDHLVGEKVVCRECNYVIHFTMITEPRVIAY